MVDRLTLGGCICGFIATPVWEGDPLTRLLGMIVVPVSVALADEDPKLDTTMRNAIESHVKGTAQPYQITLYSHVPAGFASNRAVSTKAEVFAKKQAFVQALQWFEEHFHNGQ